MWVTDAFPRRTYDIPLFYFILNPLRFRSLGESHPTLLSNVPLFVLAESLIEMARVVRRRVERVQMAVPVANILSYRI